MARFRRDPARGRHGACPGGAGGLGRVLAERRFRDGRYRCDHREFYPPPHDRLRSLEGARLRGDRAGLSGAASEAQGRRAPRSGFLGIDSLGWSTLAIVTEATEAERLAMIEQLAGQLMEKFGAPDAKAARHAAEEEIAFAASLCEHPPQTLLAVQRSVENGEIRERFRTLKPRPVAADADRLHAHASAFTFHEVEGVVEPQEEVDLLGLIRTDTRTTDHT